jgi:Ca-activated chloride channel family protein
LTTEILEGRLQAHLASPASAAFIELGNAESQARFGKPLVGKTQNLVLSPVVIAMWKPMAEALGWGKQPLGWSDILTMAGEQQGWAKYGFPQWGSFKFGHTHPEYSNSGLISLIAEVYAAAGKQRGLALEDVQQEEVADYLQKIEKSVVHYGSSTGFFGRKMFDNGPEYLSAAVLYENMIIESYDPKYQLPFPIVAIYPKEGTFWSDHPAGIVEREWVTDEHREAATIYLAYLAEEPQQRRALESGFRPADPALKLDAPVDVAHGVQPQEPQTTLEVPQANVMKSIIELWKENKKHANVALVLDVSGSMKGEKLDNAKQGALQLVEMLGVHDQLSLLPFNNTVAWAQKDLVMPADRGTAVQTVNSYFAAGGTAAFDAIAEANRHLQNAKSDRISAIVVLTDGEDTDSRLKLPQLLDQIRSDNESKNVRIFTIGYGAASNASILEEIAEATEAKSFKGTPQNIREVFKEISTFF